MTDLVDRTGVRIKDFVRWNLVKWVLWLVLFNISISEVVAEKRCVLVFGC